MGVRSAQQPIFVGNDRLDVSSWEGNWQIISTNVSTSATEGTRYAPVRGDHEATFRLPIDDENAIEAAGLELAEVVPAIYFQTGPDVYDLLENSLVVSVPTQCDGTSDVPRIQVSVKGGDLTRNVYF